ncbi:hypothetical protein ACFSJW_02300 [Flavobacterium artemisiae]|uniref:CheY chemotaxis protein or a CheY-like REC (Receiver) domain n=1 Tax=Flavobacterium artemisiae TaxID=2126556 RepID=A0ABW4HL57_9FLAO
MDKRGPIIIIEENIDNRRMFGQIFSELPIANAILYFDTLQEADEELVSEDITPFIFFANILQFEEKNKHQDIENHILISQKTDCPCLFFSILFPNCFIIDTYSVPVKSYFINPYSEEKFKQVLSSIVQFWNTKKDQNQQEIKSEKKNKTYKSSKPI